MLKLNKKWQISTAVTIFTVFFVSFLFNIRQVSALSPSINQVKIPDSTAVYYLNHATHQRKAYINEAVFLDYNNNWEDVKVISPEELATWSEARLIKTADNEDLYYINGNKKIKMQSLQDILDYKLENVLPLTVSAFELSQYESEATYQAAGLAGERSFTVSQSLVVDTQTANSLVPGTNNNQVMLLHVSAGSETIALNSLTFKLSGLYESSLIKEVYLINAANGQKIPSHSIFRDRQATVYFNQDPFYILAGTNVSLKVMLDLRQVAGTDRQDLRFSLVGSESLVANAVAVGSFPLVGSEFKMYDASSFLPQAKISEKSVGNNGGLQNLGQFVVSETSGREDIYIKEIIFRNAASAGSRDLEMFKLKKDNQVIARASSMTGNLIVFKVAYLRIGAGEQANLSVSANESENYQSGRTINLELKSAEAFSRVYNLSLEAEIENLDETIVLP